MVCKLVTSKYKDNILMGGYDVPKKILLKYF